MNDEPYLSLPVVLQRRGETDEERAERCLYGCTDPKTCPYRHDGCEHCRRVRTETVGVMHRGD